MSIFAAAAKRWEDGVPGSWDDGIAAIDLIARWRVLRRSGDRRDA
jgi:hypothetical protein